MNEARLLRFGAGKAHLGAAFHATRLLVEALGFVLWHTPKPRHLGAGPRVPPSISSGKQPELALHRSDTPFASSFYKHPVRPLPDPPCRRRGTILSASSGIPLSWPSGRWVRLAIPNSLAVPRHDGSPARAVRISHAGRFFRARLAVIKSALHATLHAALHTALDTTLHTTLDLSEFVGRQRYDSGSEDDPCAQQGPSHFFYDPMLTPGDATAHANGTLDIH